MAEARRRWTWLLALAVLLAGAGAAQSVPSQPPARGSIAGRLTDLHSMPVGGALMVMRNEATGEEARTTTEKNGNYIFNELDAGAYTVEAESEELGRGRLEGVFVTAGNESHLQTAMQFEIPPPQPIPVVIHDIAAITLTLNTSLAVKPLRQLAISGHFPELPRGMIATATPVLTETLAAKELLELPLPARLPDLPRQAPATSTAVVTATLAAEPLRALPLAGWQLEVKPDAAVSSLDVSGASAGVPLSQPRLNHMQAGSQDVDPVTPVVTTKVSGAELQALPASGRRWQDFALDTPTAAFAAGGRQQMSLRGAGQEPAETTIDGASIRLAFGGQGGSGPGSSGPGLNGQGGAAQNGMGQAWSEGHGLRVAEAAIREVETAAGNVEAKGARTAGGRMNVETQGGANELHGQGFFSDRQNNWGARNPFTRWVKQTGPGTETTPPVFTAEPYTPPDHETVWGLGLGSHIRRNKLFWFGALDSYRRNDPGLATVKHPYLCANADCTEQTGFFAQPSNGQMLVLCSRMGLTMQGPPGTQPYCPTATVMAEYSQMLETLAGLLGPAARTATQWTGFGRLDWQAAERHRFTLEGIGAKWNSPGGGLTRVEETYGSSSFGSSQASEELILGRWEAFLTPNLLAVTQGSAGRAIMSAHAETPSAFEQTLMGPNAWGQLPQIVVDNRYGLTIGNPSRFGKGSYPDEKLMEGQESLNWVRGNLLMKAGFELQHNADATSLLRNQTGTYSYANAVNFISDLWAFENGVGELNPRDQHNCDAAGTGFGNVPCYSYYSQTMGPANWHLSTNDWSGFVTGQWQAGKLFVFSAGLRWEREQLPPPIATVTNPELPLTERLPSLGNDWGPRLSMAVGKSKGHWPVLRLGYGLYYGRTENVTVETALTQTGSMNGDLNFFMRPTDDLPNHGGGAPPFPYVPWGDPGRVVKPGAVEFAPRFHNPEVHQAVAAVEESLPGHVEVTASAMVSLGRRLPISIDTNFDPAVNPKTITYAVVDGTGLGPIKTTRITVPFYASWPFSTCPSGSLLNVAGQCGRGNPNYQQITQIMSRANSTYEAAVLKVVRYGRRGLSLHAHYTYAHAMDWNPNESALVAGSDVLDPANFSQEYGTSNLDMRHSAAAMVVFEAPWKLRGVAGRAGNGWMLSGIGQFRGGMPYTMRTSGSLAEALDASGTAIVGLGPGMNGSGGDNRVYGVGRNTYRYPATWKADLRLGKKFDLGQMRQLELLAESFNLFNHQNVTELETTGYYLQSGSTGSLPTLNFLTGAKANTTAFGQPLNVNATNFYRERQIQVGVRMRF